MAVVVQYIVERNGIQKMTFDNKKDADSYDKELEISEDMSKMLEQSGVTIDEKQMEELCLFLAKNRDQASAILKGVKSKIESDVAPKKVKNNSGAKKAEDKKSTDESTAEKPADSKNKLKAA